MLLTGLRFLDGAGSSVRSGAGWIYREIIVSVSCSESDQGAELMSVATALLVAQARRTRDGKANTVLGFNVQVDPFAEIEEDTRGVRVTVRGMPAYYPGVESMQPSERAKIETD